MTHYPRLRRLIYGLGFIWVCLWLAGCSITTPQSSLDPKGPVAQKQLDLFIVTVVVCTIIFVIVGGALVWVVWRFREKPGDENKPMPSQGHGNPLIEIGLIGASIAFLVVIAVPTLRAIWFTHDLPEDQPYYQESKLGAYMDRGLISPEEKDNVLEITVRGWQWWFSFEYPQLGITTANEFVIPKGKVVKFNLRGYDVIHSFWLPKLGGKVDIVPGRKNWMWLMADEEGYYFGQCAEYCGEAHAYMLFRAEVVSDEEFNDWIASYKEGAPAPAGYQMEPTEEKPEPTNQDNWMAWSMANSKEPQSLMTGDKAKDDITAGAQHFFGKGKCIVCHAIDSSPAGGVTAPNLTKVGERKSIAAGILNHYTEDGGIDAARQQENIFEWISKSHFYKPGNLMYERMDAGLIDYKYSGLTYGALGKIGLTDKDLTSSGVSQAQLTELKGNPDAPITAVVDNQLTLRHIVERIEDNPEMMDKLASVSGWLTQEEFHQITAFLQSLK